MQNTGCLISGIVQYEYMYVNNLKLRDASQNFIRHLWHSWLMSCPTKAGSWLIFDVIAGLASENF